MANIGTKLLSQAVPTSSLYWGRNGQSLKIPPFMVRKGEDKLNDQELFEYSISEYNKPFSGWDFSHIHSRMKEDKLTWNYEETVLNETRNVNYLLDMGTGGGEFFPGGDSSELHPQRGEGRRRPLRHQFQRRRL